MENYHLGLTSEIAAQKLSVNGYNELRHQKQKNLVLLIIEIIKEPMIMLLLACGLLYIYLGDSKDSMLLITSIILLISITLFQKHRSEKVLAALKNLSSPRATVIRDGGRIIVPGREVVSDDLVLLKEGDRVPADGVILETVNLMVDESLLTGESVPVSKSIWTKEQFDSHPGGDGKPFVYSGTLVISGHGLMRVTETGNNTQIGKIGRSLEIIQDEDTLLTRETSKIVRIVGLAGLMVCLIVTVIYGFGRNDWPGGVMAGLTLALSMIPEEFTVVLVLFLTFGAWRMSKYNVLTRNNAAIETLGAATVLCVDKTGTITQNKQKLSYLVYGDKIRNLNNKRSTFDETEKTLIMDAVLASDPIPFDPLEKELKVISDQLGINEQIKSLNYDLVYEYPIKKEFTAVTKVWKTKTGNTYKLFTKGAPETVFNLCNLTKTERTKILKTVEKLSWEGIRVLAVASGIFPGKQIPKDQKSFDLKYEGLIGFSDPIRPDVPQAVATAYQAHIRIIMITGDYPGTAQYIARNIGLQNTDRVITGMDINNMNQTQIDSAIKVTNIFARILPHQKLTIVQSLKRQGQIVAMTGDGVNDAPALKSAHIGIAVGSRGTDVAREASDLVLLDDNFSSIVMAVRVGRKIFANLRKAMAYIVAVHIPIGGMSLLPVLLNLPMVLLPAHIAFLELIIDPACSLVFESQPSESGNMSSPPRNLQTPILSTGVLGVSLIQGFSILTAVFLIFLYYLNIDQTPDQARTVAFFTLVLSNIFLIIVNLSWNETIFKTNYLKNRPLIFIVTGAIILLLITVYWAPISHLFHFGSIGFAGGFLAILVSSVSMLWFVFVKYINSHFKFQ